MRTAQPCPSPHRHKAFSTAGRTAHQVNRDLRKTLSQDLQRNIDREVFSSHLLPSETPRADDVEALVASYPGRHELEWLSRQEPPNGNMNLKLWRELHANHCRVVPACTKAKINRKCYFYFIHLMLLHGFHPAYAKDKSHHDIKPHSAAYLQLWQKDPRRCKQAFIKLMDSVDLQPILKPALVFPLLPAYRGKHIWRFKKFGTDYLPRLALDICTSGGKEIFEPWSLQFLAVRALFQIVCRGDYLATKDISRYYNRLLASKRLREFQNFQDPRTYASDTRSNETKIRNGEAKFLQQTTCMFGHPQLPAYASCVSSEIARILHNGGARVAGIIIDDFLFHGPKERGIAQFQRELDQAEQTMSDLAVPANDKGHPPAQALTFAGLALETLNGAVDIDEEQRIYMIARIKDILEDGHVMDSTLQSVNGSLGWLCYVATEGRCQRDTFFKATRSGKRKHAISKPMRNQFKWWLSTLELKRYRPSRIWFRDEQQPYLTIHSDASGEAGFGFCAGGLHVSGCWRQSIAQSILNDMFVKELLPITIAVLLLSPIFHQYIFCPTVDNSGVVFRLNCGSCRNPIGLALIKVMSAALAKSDNHLLADWNNREQMIARHADDLSKTVDQHAWRTHAPSTHPPWVFDLVIHELASDKCIQTTIRIPGIWRALP